MKNLLFISILLLGFQAAAEVVVPSDRVESFVTVRTQPSSDAAVKGRLSIGESLEYISSIPYWYEVRWTDNSLGYVSKAFTEIRPDTLAVPAAFTIDVFDVASGLAILVRGEDFSLLYDGGSNDDLARGADNRLLAYLNHYHADLATIDHVMLSHPHRDHVELLADVVNSYQIRHVWNSGVNYNDCGYRAFLQAVEAEPAVIYHDALRDHIVSTLEFNARRCYGEQIPQQTFTFSHGARIDESIVTLGVDASMRFLHADGVNQTSVDENSLVILLSLGAARILIMGDADGGRSEDLASAPDPQSIVGQLLLCCKLELAADVLVVGKHGSATASPVSFLDAVDADYYLVSSGPSPYGATVLPEAAVIAELELRGNVYGTYSDDTDCQTASSKIGTDNDGLAGGCTSFRISIVDSTISIAELSDTGS
ncbi:MAG: MBL fold metallo-hydrolase [Proteobacteria bacterium]|nr:MBL fold metallo-hydrolase [Pseudomonadota bacterium]